MQNDHENNCNCLEHTGKGNLNDNHLVTDPNSIDYYLDGYVLAKKPVKIWSRPGASLGGKVIKTIPVGSLVGRVFSYTDDKKDKTGKSFWLTLTDPSAKDVNTAPIIGYTPWLKGYFDKTTLKSGSQGAKIEQQKIDAENAPLFKVPEISFPLWIKLLIAAIIVAIILGLYVKSKS